jgi:hypothetical protein
MVGTGRPNASTIGCRRGLHSTAEGTHTPNPTHSSTPPLTPDERSLRHSPYSMQRLLHLIVCSPSKTAPP